LFYVTSISVLLRKPSVKNPFPDDLVLSGESCHRKYEYATAAVKPA